MSRRALTWLFATVALLLAAPTFAADTVYYYSSDTLHSEVVVTDQNRNVVERTHYAPYGQVLDRDLRDGPGYTGHAEDPETGLVYMQQRYYDPEAGRFLSTDPVQADANGGSFNRYWYANDNPYRYTDPFGLWTCSGSKSQCATIDTGLQNVSKAAANLKAGSTDQNRLNAVVKFFGKEGVDNGVKVTFGSIKGEMANTDTKGKVVTIKFNLKEMQKQFTGRTDGSTPASEYAGLVAHEGTHGIDGLARGGNPANKGQEEATEHNAFEAQAATAKGLGINSAYGLWRNDWSPSEAGAMREQSVQNNADTATRVWCSQGSPPGC